MLLPLSLSQEALETLQEAVRELEAQPQTNLTHLQVTDSHKQLMVGWREREREREMWFPFQEFFQDVDFFEAMGGDHVSQLESTLQPLLGQQEGLLGHGKGVRGLLTSVVEGIREGYKRVEDQVCSK